MFGNEILKEVNIEPSGAKAYSMFGLPGNVTIR